MERLITGHNFMKQQLLSGTLIPKQPKKGTVVEAVAVKKKPAPKPYTPQYGVIVLCDNESHQETVYNSLKKEGYKCKVVTA